MAAGMAPGLADGPMADTPNSNALTPMENEQAVEAPRAIDPVTTTTPGAQDEATAPDVTGDDSTNGVGVATGASALILSACAVAAAAVAL